MLIWTRFQAGVGGFILPALQTQTDPPLYPDTAIMIECTIHMQPRYNFDIVNGNRSTASYSLRVGLIIGA